MATCQENDSISSTDHSKRYDSGFQQSNATSPSYSLIIKTIKDGDIDVTKGRDMGFDRGNDDI